VLEILPTPEASTSSDSEDSEDSTFNICRSLPLLPSPANLQPRDTSDSDQVPSLGSGYTDDGTISDDPSIEELVRENGTISSGISEEAIIRSDSSVSVDGQPIPAAGAEAYLPQLIQGVAQGMAISPATYVSLEAYMAELTEASRNYD